MCALAALILATAIGCQSDATGDRPRSAAAMAASGAHAALSAGEMIISPRTTPYTIAPAAARGSVSGTVTVKAALVPLVASQTGIDSALCGAAIPDESVQVQGAGLSGVVVWLDGVRSGKSLGLERRIELESNRCRL